MCYAVLLDASGDSESKLGPVYDAVSPLRLSPQEEMVECATRLDLKVDDLMPLISRHFDWFAKLDSSVLIINRQSTIWPKKLEKSPYCPRFLFLWGDPTLLLKPMVSVVGTRKPSLEGKHLAVETVDALGKAGYGVMSGLALGIDGVAHKEALRSGVSTIAVLGTPLTESYPAVHEDLQKLISEKGLLVSRFFPSMPTQKWYFLLRNRLMSSLSEATLVVEDRDGGGAVSQAEYALGEGRKVVVYESVMENSAILWPRKLASKGKVLVAKKPSSLGSLLRAGRSAKPKKVVETGQLSLF